MKGNQGCYVPGQARCEMWVYLRGSKTETAQCMRTPAKGLRFCKQHHEMMKTGKLIETESGFCKA